MTEKDKQELRDIIREEVKEGARCALGICPETAHELINLADTWKTCRRGAMITLITTAVAGILGAIWVGLKNLVIKN